MSFKSAYVASRQKEPYSITFLQALFLLFLGLKLSNHIDWSWWLIFTPMIVQFVFLMMLSIIKAKMGLK